MANENISTSNPSRVPTFFGGHPDEGDDLVRADVARFREFEMDVRAVAERHGVTISTDALRRMWRDR